MYQAWAGCEARGFIPSKNQKLVIAVVQAALDSGLFYTTDVRSFCAKAMGLTSEQDAANFQPARVEGGVFGMECYYARKYLDAMSRFAREDKAHAQLKPHVGQKLGTIMFNDFKRSTGAVVSEVKDNVIPRWPGQIPPPMATPNSPRQDDQIMTTRVLWRSVRQPL